MAGGGKDCVNQVDVGVDGSCQRSKVGVGCLVLGWIAKQVQVVAGVEVSRPLGLLLRDSWGHGG